MRIENMKITIVYIFMLHAGINIVHLQASPLKRNGNGTANTSAMNSWSRLNIFNDELSTDDIDVDIKRMHRSSFLQNTQSSQTMSHRDYFRELLNRNSYNSETAGSEITYGTPEYYPRKQSSEHPSPYTREVQLKQGRLRGIVREFYKQSDLGNVDQFLGIPYANAQRFMPPGSPLSWRGIKYAINLAPVCPQALPNLKNSSRFNKGRYDQIKRLLPFLKEESEDCLFLNLYVPSFDDSSLPTKYPVIVFLHGESFKWNSGNPYDGSILASYGQVIVITLNYRLGVLGFMKPELTDPAVSNFGLLDQIAALQWIKENIGAFRGDPNAVTLMGYDTGAICANFLMTSEIARGLFHKAILMSGSSLADWSMNKDPKHVTIQVAQKLNCQFDNDRSLVDCLRSKTYQELVNAEVSMPSFATDFGPVVDGAVIPQDPNDIMAHSDIIRNYDLLFGIVELESYNVLSNNGIEHGLNRENRDENLKLYLKNRFPYQYNLAFTETLNEYTTTYDRPGTSGAMTHRDTLLEILSDARVTAPLVQTGIHVSNKNPRCYMYVFAHNSEGGEYASESQSVRGEELPFVFGAPLGQVGPFHAFYNADERLLSEAVMRYFSNFAKTGNPKVPWPNTFTNKNPKDWPRFDVDWLSFNDINQNYLLLGMTPVVSQRYRHRYTKFWNNRIPEVLRQDPVNNQSDNYYGISKYLPELPRQYLSPSSSGKVISMFPIEVEIENPTEDPLRELRYQLQHGRHATRGHNNIITSTETINFEQIDNDTNNLLKANSTIVLMIMAALIFLTLNIIGIYCYQKNKKVVHRKYDNSNIFDTVSDDKRSKYNDIDDSFIMDVLRKGSNNTYESVKHRPPINGFSMMTRQTSTSTVDTHTKVSDWISSEVSQYSALSNAEKLKQGEKISIGIDATPQARSDSILRQEPIEITKAKGTDYSNNKIICQDVAMDMSMIAEIPLRHYQDECCKSSNGPSSSSSSSSSCASSFCTECAINHQHSYSDPVQMPPYHPMNQFYIQQQQQQQKKDQEEITSFIEGPQDTDINVTCCDENDKLMKDPLTREESIRAIQKMNYPKVLPKYPSDMQFSNSIKRRSLPPQYYQIHHCNTVDDNEKGLRPNPPPRMSSTLGRKLTKNEEIKTVLMSAPLQAEEPPKLPVDPEVTSNTLIVGPLLPKSENIYMSMQKNRQDMNRQYSTSSSSSSSSSNGNQEILNTDEKQKKNQIDSPDKVTLIKRTPANGSECLYTEVNKSTRVQTPQDGIYSITTGKSEPVGCLTERHDASPQSVTSSSSNSSDDTQSSTGTIKLVK